MRRATLCFLIRDTEICLGLKKRGFGVNRWNGFGGKIKDGESVELAVVRELEEEAGVKALGIEKVAEHFFYFPKKPGWDQVVHTYFCRIWKGRPEESSEMRPQWFSTKEIPFDLMWPDDKHWLPLVLEGKRLVTKFSFEEDDRLVDLEVKEVGRFDD